MQKIRKECLGGKTQGLEHCCGPPRDIEAMDRGRPLDPWPAGITGISSDKLPGQLARVRRSSPSRATVRHATIRKRRRGERREPAGWWTKHPSLPGASAAYVKRICTHDPSSTTCWRRVEDLGRDDGGGQVGRENPIRHHRFGGRPHGPKERCCAGLLEAKRRGACLDRVAVTINWGVTLTLARMPVSAA